MTRKISGVCMNLYWQQERKKRDWCSSMCDWK